MALFIGLIYVILYPILYMLSTTFRTDADSLDPSVVWIPKHVTLNNLRQAFVSMKYLNSLWNTVSVMLVSALLQVGVTAVVGYGFARFKFRFKKLLFALVLFTIVVPAQTTIIPVFVGFSNFDVLGIVRLINALTGADIILRLTNTPLVMYLPALFGMGIRSGLFIYIFRQFFRNMPKELGGGRHDRRLRAVSILYPGHGAQRGVGVSHGDHPVHGVVLERLLPVHHADG